jgi:tetratricopeptide (TPR) repeat protein
MLFLAADLFADVVKTAAEKYDGRIESMSPSTVEVVVANSSEKIPVNEIESIDFTQCPTTLTSALRLMDAGRFSDAEKELEKVKTAQIERSEVLQEYEFCKAMCAARLALEGKGEIADAGRLMAAFDSSYPKSYRHYEACETLGELLLAIGQYAKAREYYERVGKAPWPDYKMRATVAVGEILLYDKKFDDALKLFETVQKTSAQGEQAVAYQNAAAIGKARCLIESGKAKEAVDAIDAIIAKAAADDASVLAKAYTAKGIALQKLGKPQEAIFAFLRVETLYPSQREPRAESLFHLVGLWQELKRPDRMAEAQRILTSQYGSSPWCKQIEGK